VCCSVITGAFFFIRSLLQYVNREGWAGRTYETGWLLTAFFFVDAYLLGKCELQPHGTSWAGDLAHI
jgi:hypothetical protein